MKVVAQLTPRFRVVLDYDPPQWVLQRVQPKTQRPSDHWKAISYCQTREGLLLAIREKLLGHLPPEERLQYPGLNVDQVRNLPDSVEKEPDK